MNSLVRSRVEGGVSELGGEIIGIFTYSWQVEARSKCKRGCGETIKRKWGIHMLLAGRGRVCIKAKR